VELISKLPTLLEMRAQFLGLLEAPMTQTLGTIQAMLTSVIYCLDNKAKKE
jgi:large subunit ribosomal protein L10